MSRGNFKIRPDHSEADREPTGQGSNWLDRFAESYAKAEAEGKTAVEVARDRMEQIPTSMHDQISAIMNGGRSSGHGSVEDAVKDYQERTGLTDYLQQAQASQQLQDVAAIIKGAEDDDALIVKELPPAEPVEAPEPIEGCFGDGEPEKKKAPTKENLIKSLEKLLDKLKDKDEKEDTSKEDKKSEENEDDEPDPEIIRDMPEIGQFIHNVLENSPGIHFPAVVQMISETFGRELSPQQLDDPVLVRYIDKRRQPPKDTETNANLGRGLGTQRDTDLFGDVQNNDPFSFGRPSSRY